LGFYLRDLLPIPMELAPPMQALYSFCSFWTVWSCIYIYYCFVYSVIALFLFTSPSVRTSLREYVAGLSIPNPFNLFWGVTGYVSKYNPDTNMLTIESLIIKNDNIVNTILNSISEGVALLFGNMTNVM
jgi:hypothetical protein